MTARKTRIYTMDLETDPFKRDAQIKPFCAGLYDGETFRYTWGSDCVERMVAILSKLPPGIVYLHNGGKFDILFMLQYLAKDKSTLIIKERITQAHLQCAKGFHRVRDSLKILPFALREYRKDDIEYWKLEREHRDAWRDEILHYLRGDCEYLYRLCQRYVDEFGPSITIGSTAIKELRKFHDTGADLNADQDRGIRERYYFGARVERWEVGVFEGDWKVYDVNSMYPYVMAEYRHPVGAPTSYTTAIDEEQTFFITARGFSRGAFPVRDKLGVSFPHGYGEYSVSIHEWRAAEELGLFDCDQVLECVNFAQWTRFDKFVLHYYQARYEARIALAAHFSACSECDSERGAWCAVADELMIRILFYKFLLNNSYGKFAMNPDNFKDYCIADDRTNMRFYGYEMAEVVPGLGLIIWAKDVKDEDKKYANIAIGASITGAARSVLMRGIAKASRPMYCDTDSIICEGLADLPVDDAVLGAWKLEKQGNILALAGRKMYALFAADDEVCKAVKYATKGVRLSPFAVRMAALGETVVFDSETPTLRLDGSVTYLSRRIRRT